MPATKPLEIKFDVNVNGKIVAFTDNEIYENTDIPYGSYSTIAPCIGDITITKYPKSLMHDSSKIDQIYMSKLIFVSNWIAQGRLLGSG